MTCYPRGMRIVGAIFSAALIVMVIIGWVMLPAELKALFTPFQLITLLGVLVVIVGLIGVVAMSVVRADADGISFRNALRTHSFGWHEVDRIVFRPGDPWPALLINAGDPEQEGRRYYLLGIQGSDGARAVDAVTALRRLQRRAVS